MHVKFGPYKKGWVEKSFSQAKGGTIRLGTFNTGP